MMVRTSVCPSFCQSISNKSLDEEHKCQESILCYVSLKLQQSGAKTNKQAGAELCQAQFKLG